MPSAIAPWTAGDHAAAKAAYIISPPSNQSPDFLAEKSEFLAHVAEAITASKIPHIVVLSSVGAQHATGTGPIRSLHTAEQVLAHAAPSVTFLRAAYFLVAGALLSLVAAAVTTLILPVAVRRMIDHGFRRAVKASTAASEPPWASITWTRVKAPAASGITT